MITIDPGILARRKVESDRDTACWRSPRVTASPSGIVPLLIRGAMCEEADHQLAFSSRRRHPGAANSCCVDFAVTATVADPFLGTFAPTLRMTSRSLDVNSI